MYTILMENESEHKLGPQNFEISNLHHKIIFSITKSPVGNLQF